MMVQVILIIGCIVCGVIAFVIGSKWRMIADKKYREKVISESREEGERLVREAQKEAELSKKTALLEAKDEWFKAKSEFEKDAAKTRESIRAEQQKLKEADIDLKRRDDTVAKREAEFTARESFLNSKEKTLRNKDSELTKLVAMENEKLEKISHMTQDEAKKILMTNLEGQVRYEAAQMIKEIKDTAKAEAENEAKEIVVQAIQRCAADATVESTVSVVHLPNDEMKGRIIGREGRNIRSFEEATGVDVIVDDTPEAVILSGFDPIKREIARMALEKLITDDRIHPGRIEELIKKKRKRD
jgi:ribonucrease Y